MNFRIYLDYPEFVFVSAFVFVFHVRHARKSVDSGGRTDITTQRSSATEEITDFTFTTSTRPFRTSVSGKSVKITLILKMPFLQTRPAPRLLSTTFLPVGHLPLS